MADRVSVYTKSHEEAQQWVWQSSVGSHQYTIKEDDSGAPMARGTRVVLHLKEDAQELADPVRLAKLIKQYSQFIQFPIKLYSARKEAQQVRARVRAAAQCWERCARVQACASLLPLILLLPLLPRLMLLHCCLLAVSLPPPAGGGRGRDRQAPGGGG